MTRTSPPIGRRRGAVLLSAIRSATISELEEHGYAGVSFDGVARRARTSRPVLYRRYRTRAELVADALSVSLRLPLALPGQGSLRGDLVQLFEAIVEPSRRLSPRTRRALLGEADDELMTTISVLNHAPAEEALAHVVDGARLRGELGPAPIPTTALLAPVIVLSYESLEREVSDSLLAEVVDTIALPLYRAATGTASPSVDRHQP